MLDKNTSKCFNQYNTGYENWNMPHAIIFNYFESGAIVSDLLGTHRESTEKLLDFSGSHATQNIPNDINKC